MLHFLPSLLRKQESSLSLWASLGGFQHAAMMIAILYRKDIIIIGKTCDPFHDIFLLIFIWIQTKRIPEHAPAIMLF